MNTDIQQSNKPRRVPWFARNREACPDCGFIPDEIQLEVRFKAGLGFDCARCGAHYSEQDFNDSNRDKWAKTADLTSENNGALQDHD